MKLSIAKKLIGGSVLLASAFALAVELSGSFRLSAVEINGLLAETTNGLAFTRLPTGTSGPVVVAVRRETSGEVEIHEHFHDIFVAQSGRASVLLGGDVEGQHETSPGEWLGGTMVGSQTYKFEAGDVIWIPAGVPHRMLIPDGGTFIYLAFKYPK
ncbi:MAG TPA: hypothetical protein PKK10_03015 [Woeseiaceae bacterium]|nr:hypothetical protein [Woeseiaceae bacterium]